MSISYAVVLRSVVNKDIVKEICEFVESGLEDLGTDWNIESERESFVELIEEYIADDTGEKIEQFKVICDRRNNKVQDMNNGIYYFDVEFRQINSFIATKISYKISTQEARSLLKKRRGN